MSKRTVSAAGGAMPAEGHKPASLLTVAEALDQTRSLIIAASNLAAAIDDTQGQGLHAVICAAEEQFEIAHDWFLERHGASPTSNPASSEAGVEQRRELLHVVNDIDEVRHLNEAAWMAASDLDREHRDGMHALLTVVSDKLTAARDKLDVARGAHAEDRSDD